MKHKLTEKEFKSMMSFLVETFGFSDEQMAAIDHQAPMTQGIYDSILIRCGELGEDADRLFFQMMEEYPEFMINSAKKISDEVVKYE